MSHETKSDEFLKKFDTLTEPAPGGGIRPLRTPKKFHTVERDIYAVLEFPTKVCMQAFAEVFGQDNQADIQTALQWRYSEDTKQTGIFILDQWTQVLKGEIEIVEAKPGVIVQRGPVAPTNTDGRTRQKRTALDLSYVQFSERLQVPMTIHCIAKEDVDAERIASVVLAVLMVDELTWKARGCHAILNPSASSIMPFQTEQEIELSDCPVSFVMEYTWSWARRSDGRLLPRVSCVDIKDP